MVYREREGDTVEALETRALKIDSAHRHDEAALYQSRWWDYREMHPTQATYAFADAYRAGCEDFRATYVDERTFEDASSFTPDDIFASTDLVSMWLARQVADQVGVPYPFVMYFAKARALDRRYYNFPRPNQLCGEEFELDLADAWRDTSARSIRYSEIAKLKASCSTRGDLWQAHANFVVAQVKGRPTPHHRLLGRLFFQDILDSAWCRDHFTQAEVDAAEAFVSTLGNSQN